MISSDWLSQIFEKKKKKKKISGPNLGVKGLNQAQVMFFAIFLGLDH